MPDDPLTPAEEDLARLAETLGHADPYLADLVELADQGVSSPVGLFANGMIFVGTVVASKAMATEMDAHRHRFAEAARSEAVRAEELPEGADLDAYERSLREFETAATTALRETDTAKAAFEEAAADYVTEEGFDYRRAPGSLSRKALRFHTRRFITLEDAQIATPGQTGLVRLPVVRVMIQHVVGWWLIALDETGSASFQLWT